MQTQATVLPSPAWEHQANSSVACPIMNAANFCSTSTLSSRSHSHSFRSFPMMPLFTAPTSPVLLPEIISIVCAYLDAPSLAVATRINRTWSAISLPLLYREITLAWRGFKIDSLELGVRRNGHHCRKLAAAREVNHWCSRIMALLRGMPNLLDLDATWMDADLLASLVYLQKLERLSISRLQGSQSEENEFFEPSFQGSRRIVELNMADSSQMTDSALVSITRTCPQIRVLIVSGNKGLTHEGLIQWCEQIATSSSSSSSSSASLHHHPNYSFTNSRLYLSKAPVVGMTELTTINFANCNQIQSTGFQALFECSRNLQHVNLMSTRVEDAALQVLASQNKSLKSLVLNCCAAISNLGLQTLLRQCRQLRAVSFLYCHRITIRVFFQNLWKCLGLQELRFSLNGRHMDLIEHGLTGGAPAPVMEVNPSAVTTDTETETETGIQGDASSVFYEPQLEYLVYGGPELDDTPMNSNQLSASVNNINTTPMSSLADHFHRDEDNSFSSVQEYRQHLILTQVYRQIEQLTQLSVLDMRDIHLPLDLAKGFSRLGHLEKLQVLELTGLGQPLGQPEVDWLLGAMNQDTLVVEEQSRREKTPLPSLHQLVFKGGYSMSTKLLQKLKDHRPCLEVQLTQVKDLA